MTQDIVCQNCGSVNDYTVKVTELHNTAYCNGCEKYIKHLPKDQNIKIHFGKYAGREIKSLTSDEEIRYLFWVKTLENIKPRLKEAIERHLKTV